VQISGMKFGVEWYYARMPSTSRLAPDRLQKRMCLSCGKSDPSLQGESGLHVYECPSCGADLYARPARSYAEMEGFSVVQVNGRSSTFERLSTLMLTTTDPAAESRRRRERLLHLVMLTGALASAMVLAAAVTAVTLLLFV